MGAENGNTANVPAHDGTWRVRIRSTTGDVLGAGILLGSETVLTCAHVIPGDGRPLPATEVRVDLVGVPDAEPVSARVAPGCWVPQRADSCGDVALLRLSRPQPAEHAAPLFRLPPVSRRPVRMCGFPDGNDDGMWFLGRLAGAAGPRAEWVQVNPETPGDVVRYGFSGAGVEDEQTHHVIGMVVSRYDDSDSVPSAERRRFSYMIPVETIVRHLPQVARWVGGEAGVDPRLVSPLTGGVQDIGFAQRLALWLRRESLAGREGIADVETVVIEDDDSDRYGALSRAVTLADRELSVGGAEAAVSAAPRNTVPPIGSLDLAIDVTGRTDTDVARRVADRMDLKSLGDTSPLSRIRANAVPLTIVAVSVDRAHDPEALVHFMKLLADRGSRLMLVFRDPRAPGLRLAERLFRPDRARIDAWLDELARQVTRAEGSEREAVERRALLSPALNAPYTRNAPALRINLLRLRDDPGLHTHHIIAKMAAFEHAAATVLRRAEAARHAADEQLKRIPELESQLAPYAARLGAMGAAERPELIPLQRAAFDLLRSVPYDVPAAQEAVDRFVRAVNEIGT
ncbi:MULTISPECIES: serine protease [unclassified Streptomyces]|uniref:S1 family peptidase n=1 Tax=unclassified Streptomyces TaxID=2593676 RepID=UPI00336A3D72